MLLLLNTNSLYITIIVTNVYVYYIFYTYIINMFTLLVNLYNLVQILIFLVCYDSQPFWNSCPNK